jgi:hypothetical protein
MNTGRYADAGAFRQALEERLRAEAGVRGVPINDLRLKVVMERLLARLFMRSDAPWLLKGGYAMELRYRPQARTTRDLDLTADGGEGLLSVRLAGLRDRLQEAAEIDPGDFLVFRFDAVRQELSGAPSGGGRFPVVGMLAGREYARFHVDVGFGDVVVGVPEELIGEGMLRFAGVGPATVRAVPREVQFAEKIHAMTYPWPDRQSTRVKDLVDILVLIERGRMDAGLLRAAVQATFARRATHAVPIEVARVPDSWSAEFGALANEAGVGLDGIGAAMLTLRAYWDRVMGGGHPEV